MPAEPSFSARIADCSVFSYRADASVPKFDDSRALIVYDGVCVLCSGAMRAIAARDHTGHFQFASAQSPLGKALFEHYGLDPLEFETVLLLSQGRAFAKLDMAVEVARVLGGPWHLFDVFRPLPRTLQDRVYDLIAKNRYRLFGRTDACMLPDPSWRARVIDHPSQQ